MGEKVRREMEESKCGGHRGEGLAEKTTGGKERRREAMGERRAEASKVRPERTRIRGGRGKGER